MRNLKKLASVVLAVVMALAMMAPAFATEGDTTPTATITIKNSLEGKSYDIYKIFDMTVTGEGSEQKVAYSIAVGWNDFFTGEGKGAGYLSDEASNTAALVNVEGVTKYLTLPENGAKNVVTFAADALDYALTTENLTKTTVQGTGSDVTETLPYGYYLTYLRGATQKTADSQGSLCSLSNVTKDVTLKIKSTTPTIEKTVDHNVKGVGEDANFTITGKVPDVTNYENYTYKITDTMSNGLEFTETKLAALKVTIGDNVVTDGVEKKINGNGFELTIARATLADATPGTEIKVEYSATVTEAAITTDATNSAKLTYSNDPNNDGTGTIGTGETTPEVVKIFTTSIDVNKYALNVEEKEDDSNKLAGAKFVLYKEVDEGESEDATTVKMYYVKNAETGEISWTKDASEATVRTSVEGTGLLDAKFDGLGNGTYYLEEIEAPAGYNKLAAPEAITINVQPETLGTDADKTNAELVGTVTDNEGNVTEKYIVKANLNQVHNVVNSTGAELPETGGIGTTIFYTLGGLLVAGAGVLLIVKKRMGAE